MSIQINSDYNDDNDDDAIVNDCRNVLLFDMISNYYYFIISHRKT